MTPFAEADQRLSAMHGYEAVKFDWSMQMPTPEERAVEEREAAEWVKHLVTPDA